MINRMRCTIMIIGLMVVGMSLGHAADKSAKVAAKAESKTETKAEKKVKNKFLAAFGTKNTMTRPKASKKHDMVRVVIDDEVEASAEAKTELKSDSSHTTDLSQLVMLSVDKNGNLMTTAADAVAKTTSEGDSGEGKAKTLFKIPLLNASSESEHNGEGTTERKSKTKVELAGEVLEVLPNGHLIVEARRTETVGGETTIITLTGRVDPRSLDEDSAVNAKDMIDRKVSITGKGEVTQNTRRGWLTKIWNIFKPL